MMNQSGALMRPPGRHLMLRFDTPSTSSTDIRESGSRSDRGNSRELGNGQLIIVRHEVSGTDQDADVGGLGNVIFN